MSEAVLSSEVALPDPFSHSNSSLCYDTSQASIFSKIAPPRTVDNQTSLTSETLFDAKELFELFQSARLFCENIDELQLRKALREAASLLRSGLFSDFQHPQIGVDEHGEFSFSIKKPTGYLAIGVSGEGEISFHVRNDANPHETSYGDEPWDGGALPENLVAPAFRFLEM